MQTIRRKDFWNQSKIMSQKWLKRIPVEKGWYLAGFVDGEGSFNVSLVWRPDYRTSWKITPNFNVAQRDKTILFLLKKYFGCGRINQRKDGVGVYVVENSRAIQERIIPFFKRFKLLSSKAKTNFSIFCQIMDLFVVDEHLTNDGLRKICILREKLNEGRGRKRKYNLSDIMISKVSPETIR